MRAEIVAVGSEMLTPAHIDTNSLFITERLNEIGISLQAKAVAGDDRKTLKAIVADALRRTELLILTGGLGPTDDDLTRDVVADITGRSLEFHADIFEAIEKRFAARGLPTPQINRRQAMVISGADILPNRYGTAPGLWLEHDGAVLLLLPGPPRELKPMFEAVVQERLTARAGSSRLLRRRLCITGQTESYIEEKMQPLYAVWKGRTPGIDATILASLGQIEVHLTATAADADEAGRALDVAVTEVEGALGGDLFSTRGESMQQVVGGLLRSRGLRIAAAESCTGGLLMARLTEVPGSSDYVDRGVVVYTNQSKIDLLGVPSALIAMHGAVSEPVAESMATGVVRSGPADLGVAITGIAGPSGGTEEKPVGTVAVAVAWCRGESIETRGRLFRFPGGRDQVRFQASQAALDMVRRWLCQ